MHLTRFADSQAKMETDSGKCYGCWAGEGSSEVHPGCKAMKEKTKWDTMTSLLLLLYGSLDIKERLSGQTKNFLCVVLVFVLFVVKSKISFFDLEFHRIIIRFE